MRAILFAAALSSALFLPACGIKGPLYLPEVRPAPPRASPAAGADNSKAVPTPTESR
jgi:predicted small lipoprotein YifL